MNTEQILKVLKNERECIRRQSDSSESAKSCLKDANGVKLCGFCDLCLPEEEILAVYDYLIERKGRLKNEVVDIYPLELEPEDMPKFLNDLASEYFEDDFDMRMRLASCSIFIQVCNKFYYKDK